MKLWLDEQDCPCDATTIGEAIAEGAARAQERGRLVVEVAVDGVVWNDEAFNDPDIVTSEADEVRLVSTDRVRMVVSVMDDAIRTLDEIENRQLIAADQLDAGDHATGMASVGEAVGLWSAIHQAINLSGDVVSLRLDEPLDPIGPPMPVLNELTTCLGNLKTSIVRQDVVVIGDVLRYEMPDVLDRWRQLLRGLRERVLEESDA